MRDKHTHAIEDYLKTIYEITTTHPRASTKQVAKILEVSPASVTGMLQKLAETDPPLVEYQKHRGVVLTSQGEKVALEILRHHRLLECFLHQILGYEWDEVHAEADRLEHVISEEMEERIAICLGNPQHDPHGDPIPSRDLHMPQSTAVTLSQLRPPQKAQVKRVSDSDPNLLRYLSERGIEPAAQLETLDYSPFDNNLKVQVSGEYEPVVLGSMITSQVFVEILD